MPDFEYLGRKDGSIIMAHLTLADLIGLITDHRDVSSELPLLGCACIL